MPESRALRLYGQTSERSTLAWAWVDSQLAAAPTYWATARNQGHPHPRPVWGIWRSHRLHLSIGSPAIVQTLSTDPVITVHLESGTDVIILEGHCVGTITDAEVIADYDRKYDWTYDVATYGSLTCVEPETILAWRASGWAGRESFQATGRWEFP